MSAVYVGWFPFAFLFACHLIKTLRVRTLGLVESVSESLVAHATPAYTRRRQALKSLRAVGRNRCLITFDRHGMSAVYGFRAV